MAMKSVSFHMTEDLLVELDEVTKLLNESINATLRSFNKSTTARLALIRGLASLRDQTTEMSAFEEWLRS